MPELMVRFAPGTTEAEARSTVDGLGGTVRRRMRTDHESTVMLLVQVSEKAESARGTYSGAPGVDYVEVNSDAYGPLGS